MNESQKAIKQSTPFLLPAIQFTDSVFYIYSTLLTLFRGRNQNILFDYRIYNQSGSRGGCKMNTQPKKVIDFPSVQPQVEVNMQ